MRIDYENDVIKRSHESPVVVQFTASWCGPCRIMKPMTSTVEKNRNDFELVLIDVDNNPEPSIKNGIRAVPTVLMFKQGTAVSKYTGGFSAVKFNDWLDLHINP